MINLATHTSALPREQPDGAAHRPVFVWPTRQQRRNQLSTATLKTAPGSQAAHSDLTFSLLTDALPTAAGKSYPQLFEEQITRPLGTKDTTFAPSPGQCRRLMIPGRGASLCNNALAAIGSGGAYLMPGDMMRWMQQFLSSDFYTRNQQTDRIQTLIYQRNQLTRVIGMDVSDRADTLGLGQVYMKPKNDHPGIIQKTGGGGGFITYMAMNPQANVGAFVVITRSSLTRFNDMNDGTNDLVNGLGGAQPSIRTASQQTCGGFAGTTQRSFRRNIPMPFQLHQRLLFHKIRQTMTDLITHSCRLHQSAALCALFEETTLSLDDLVLPIFAGEEIGDYKAVEAMPGVIRIPEKYLAREIERIANTGIRSVMTFGVSHHTDAIGSDTWDEDGLVARMSRICKPTVPEMIAMSNTCFCEYTSHGHCGVLCDHGVDNDATLENLGKQTVVAAAARAGFIAPSATIDSQV